MKFQEHIKQKLGIYREKNLGISEAGIFKYRGKNLSKKHILPLKFSKFNIIENYREEFYSSPEAQINFHKYFHHLNSSQALCINLFFPLIFENKLNLLSKMLCIPINDPVKSCFEKESQIEIGNRRKTNFDFFMQLPEGVKIYFEIKYTEEEFGKTKDDSEHRAKFKETYKPLLKNNAFIKKEYHEMLSFFDKYQIMRNLCHIDDHSYVVFVYPTENVKVHKQALFAQNQLLTDKGKRKFQIMPIQTIINNILGNDSSEKIRKHYTTFNEKYLSA